MIAQMPPARWRILASFLIILAALSAILTITLPSQQALAARGAATTDAERRNQAVADNERRFGDYVLHYSLLYSSFLPPEVAAAIGIIRSRNRAVINISLRRMGRSASTAGEATVVTAEENGTGTSGEGVSAELSGTMTDLIHTHPLNFQEVREAGAIYYLAPLRFGHRDTLYFEVQALAEGESTPYRLKFERQLYVDGKR